MNRQGFFLIVIIVTINAGLFTTGNISDFGAFENLSVALNQFRPVGASGNVQGFSSSASVGSNLDDFPFFSALSVIWNTVLGVAKIVVFLLIGSIQLLQLLDTGGSWGLIILAPIAVIQILAMLYLIIDVVGAIAGLRP